MFIEGQKDAGKVILIKQVLASTTETARCCR